MQLGASLTANQGVAGLSPGPAQGQMSVSGESMCIKY